MWHQISTSWITADRMKRDARVFKELGCIQCHRFAGGGGGAGPDLSGVAQEANPTRAAGVDS